MVLVGSTEPEQAPYFFLTCGEQEGLLSINRKFASLSQQRHINYEFHSGPGGHDWNQWNSHVPALMDSLMQHITVK